MFPNNYKREWKARHRNSIEQGLASTCRSLRSSEKTKASLSLSLFVRATKHPGKKAFNSIHQIPKPWSHACVLSFRFRLMLYLSFFCVLNFNSAGLSLYRFPPLHLTSFVKLYHTHMLCFESKTFFALCVVFIFFFQRLFIYFFHFQIFDCVRYGI